MLTVSARGLGLQMRERLALRVDQLVGPRT